jgi:hypothetical protein
VVGSSLQVLYSYATPLHSIQGSHPGDGTKFKKYGLEISSVVGPTTLKHPSSVERCE